MFFTLKTKKAFIKLRQAFIEALIQNYVYLEYHIQIQTEASGFAIRRIFS